MGVFISHKIRRFKKEAFGFVRFAALHEAKNAICHLDGLWVKGGKLRVAMARFYKGGLKLATKILS